MPDNVALTPGPLVVATKGDATGVQHQEVVVEFLTSAGQPVVASTISSLPVTNDTIVELLTAILLELRVLNDLQEATAFGTNVLSDDELRFKNRDLPVTIVT